MAEPHTYEVVACPHHGQAGVRHGVCRAVVSRSDSGRITYCHCQETRYAVDKGQYDALYSAVEALARFEFERLERESDMRPSDGPLDWEDAEPPLREEILSWARDALGAVAEATGEEGPPAWPRSEWHAELRFITHDDRLAAEDPQSPAALPRNVHEWTLDEVERAQDRGIVPRASVRLEVLDGVRAE